MSRLIPSVTSVDLQVPKNSTAHRTDQYDLSKRGPNSKLVIRRGQTFEIDINFNTAFDVDRDFLILLFTTSGRPIASRGTEISIPVWNTRSEQTRRWNAWILRADNNKLTLSVYASPDCVIGIWNMQVIVMRKEDAGRRRPDVTRHTTNGIYILFNPWSQEDSVYLENEELKREYVLNDIGKIWRGTANFFRPSVWSFGQFETNVLDACMAVLDRSRLNYARRGDVLHVSRTCAAMVNANDDNGVVVGNWSGEYSEGTAPTAWQGSVQILDKWNKSGRPVLFGQCWVFAGVLNTVLRGLGIPSRVISNFNSAHDTDTTITSDVHVDATGNKIASLNNDSIWNFHVWNEGWMKRPDLGPGNNGWQVLDSTPQERSGGIFRVGPTSVAAVKKGEVGLQYDGPFVFAEVNADKILWVHREGDITPEAVRIDTTSIGRFISTKRPGPLRPANQDREDITLTYKFRESTREERDAVLKAINAVDSTSQPAYTTLRNPDILQCEVILPENGTKIGESFVVKAKLKNVSLNPTTAEITFRIESTIYNGTFKDLIKTETSTVTLQPGQELEVTTTVTPQDYLEKLTDQASMLCAVLVRLTDESDVYRSEESYRVDPPEITIQAGSLEVNKESTVNASFTNPLNKPLTGAKFTIEGPGIEEPIERTISNVPANGEARVSINIKPKQTGNKVLLANFTSNELKDVAGNLPVTVQ